MWLASRMKMVDFQPGWDSLNWCLDVESKMSFFSEIPKYLRKENLWRFYLYWGLLICKSRANLIFQVLPDYIWFLWTFALKSVLPKNIAQCPRLGLEPGLLALELSALTMRPPRLKCWNQVNHSKLFHDQESWEAQQLRWLNTVFARTLADSVCAQGLQKQTCRWYSDHFICSMPALSLLFFFVIERINCVGGLI